MLAILWRHTIPPPTSKRHGRAAHGHASPSQRGCFGVVSAQGVAVLQVSVPRKASFGCPRKSFQFPILSPPLQLPLMLMTSSCLGDSVPARSAGHRSIESGATGPDCLNASAVTPASPPSVAYLLPGYSLDRKGDRIKKYTTE